MGDFSPPSNEISQAEFMYGIQPTHCKWIYSHIMQTGVKQIRKSDLGGVWSRCDADGVEELIKVFCLLLGILWPALVLEHKAFMRHSVGVVSIPLTWKCVHSCFQFREKNQFLEMTLWNCIRTPKQQCKVMMNFSLFGPNDNRKLFLSVFTALRATHANLFTTFWPFQTTSKL